MEYTCVGRYEVQISDNAGTDATRVTMDRLRLQLYPQKWPQSPPANAILLDITLTGRYINVVANGKTIICNQPIPGIPVEHSISNEGEPGPIMTRAIMTVEYRNLVITPAK